MVMDNLTHCTGRVKYDIEFSLHCAGRSKGGKNVSRQDALVGLKETRTCHVQVGRSLVLVVDANDDE